MIFRKAFNLKYLNNQNDDKCSLNEVLEHVICLDVTSVNYCIGNKIVYHTLRSYKDAVNIIRYLKKTHWLCSKEM